MFEINTKNIDSEKSRIIEYGDDLKQWREEIGSIGEELRSLNLEGITESLSVILENISRESNGLTVLSDAMARINGLYSKAEDEVIERIRNNSSTGFKHHEIGSFVDKGKNNNGIDMEVMNELVGMIH